MRYKNTDLLATNSDNDILDERVTSVGAVSFSLIHDRFFSENLEIWTGKGKTGTQLIMYTDFEPENSDAALEKRSTFYVYSTIKVTNATYQTGDLYINYHVCADYIMASDVGTWTGSEGETAIDIAKLKIVYYDTSGVLRLGDKRFSTSILIAGFAINEAWSGTIADIQTQGLLDGFTGLSVGAEYFLGNDGDYCLKSEIGVSDNIVSVGVAKSTTTLDVKIFHPSVDGVAGEDGVDGVDGVDGAPGSAALAYDPLYPYSLDEPAIYGAEIYYSLADLNTGNQPDISPLSWEKEPTIIDASETDSGLVNTTTQSFAGIKTFNNKFIIDSDDPLVNALQVIKNVADPNNTPAIMIASDGEAADIYMEMRSTAAGTDVDLADAGGSADATITFYATGNATFLGTITAPTLNGSATEWDGASKTVSTVLPTAEDGVDGDMWFVYVP